MRFFVWVRNISPSRPLRKPVSLIRNYIYFSGSVFIWCNVLIVYWHIRIVSMLFIGVSIREIPLSHACHANTVFFAAFNASLYPFVCNLWHFDSELLILSGFCRSLSRVARISSQFHFAVLNKQFAVSPKCNSQRSYDWQSASATNERNKNFSQIFQWKASTSKNATKIDSYSMISHCNIGLFVWNVRGKNK